MPPVLSREGSAADELEQRRARTAGTWPCAASRLSCQLRHGSPSFGSFGAGALVYVRLPRPKGAGGSETPQQKTGPSQELAFRRSTGVTASATNLVVAQDVPPALAHWDDVVSAKVVCRAAVSAIRMAGDGDLPQLLVRGVVATLRGRALPCPAKPGLLTLIGPAACSVVVALRGHTAAVTAKANGHRSTSLSWSPAGGAPGGHRIRLKEASTLNLRKRYVARRHQKQHERIEAERARQKALAGQDAQEAARNVAKGSAGAQSMFPPS
jgi:hypothetical protein